MPIEKDKLEFEKLRKEFVRCTFPNGREAYMHEFEEKFETSVNNMKLGVGIYRGHNKYWKTNASD